MNRLRHSVAIIVLAPLAAAWVSGAAEAKCSSADASLAGHYYLRGVMEVGSELLLHADGRFEYMLAYGALDEYATGCWSREGQTVSIVASQFKANSDDPMKFERLELEIKPGGKLERRFDGGPVGVYSR
ncbi:MAG TPA: hypothetical protein VIF34_11890 [Methylocystis sp.]|jgi:hypothetical protein